MEIKLKTSKNDIGGVLAEVLVNDVMLYDWEAYSESDARREFNTIRDRILKFKPNSEGAIYALCYITRTGARMRVAKIDGVEPVPEWAIELDKIGAADLVSYEDEGYKFLQLN